MSRPVRGIVLGQGDGGAVEIKLCNGVTVTHMDQDLSIGDNVRDAWDFTEDKVHRVWKEGETVMRKNDERGPEDHPFGRRIRCSLEDIDF